MCGVCNYLCHGFYLEEGERALVPMWLLFGERRESTCASVVSLKIVLERGDGSGLSNPLSPCLSPPPINDMIRVSFQQSQPYLLVFTPYLIGGERTQGLEPSLLLWFRRGHLSLPLGDLTPKAASTFCTTGEQLAPPACSPTFPASSGLSAAPPNVRSLPSLSFGRAVMIIIEMMAELG